MQINIKRVTSLLLISMTAVLINKPAVGAENFSDNNRWWVRAGPAFIAFDEGVRMSVTGHHVPGAGLKVKNNLALLSEFGYRLTPAWSLGLTVGVPPTTSLHSRGSIAQAGRVGKVTYAPAALTLQYQFNPLGDFHPYLGAGPAFMRVFNTHDDAVKSLHVKNAWGAVMQAGAEYQLTERFGVFLDVKKLILRTDASGYMNGARTHARVRLDPLVVQTGIALHF